MSTTVAGLVLAAGGGRRLGRPKAGVAFEGRSLAARAAQLLVDADCRPVVTVLGPEVPADLDTVATEIVTNGDWACGIGSSLRAGLAALAGRADAAVILLADQPLLTTPSIRRAVEAWRGGALAVVTTYGDRPGHPVLLDASVWDDVAATAVGDIGARPWLESHPDQVTRVPGDDVGAPLDVDTPEDLEALRSRGGQVDGA